MQESILAILPLSLQSLFANLPEDVAGQLEEIRIREDRPLEIVYSGTYRFVSGQGGLLEHPSRAYRPTRDDCIRLLELLTHYSVYSFEEQLRCGYITVCGGHRVGLAGRTVTENGKVRLLKDISGFNIRIARDIAGAADRVLPYLLDYPARKPHHTLVVSPPQQGKTTLIRDLARRISQGFPSGADRGLKVGIVDERSEIAACVKGVPRFDLGPRTDVLDGCPKAEGMMMLLRSMSPDVLVVDEIGRPEDAEAVREALHAGSRVIATAHGNGLEDVRNRPILRELIRDAIFSRYVVLSRKYGAGTLEAVYNERGERVPLTASALPARG
jgi:stage III sporulation protein AA